MPASECFTPGRGEGVLPYISHIGMCHPKGCGWNPVNMVTKGPKKSGHINGVAVLTRVSFTRKCLAVFARRPKKVAVIMR